MIKKLGLLCLYFISFATIAQFAPAAGQPGSTAIAKDSSIFINWASHVIAFLPGPENISNGNSSVTSFGSANNAIGAAEGNSADVVSLGDGGSITLGFHYPIANGSGPDFAVFENSFSDTYLEFAFVEVSTNGFDFVRFPSISNTPTIIQTASFGTTDPSLVYNLAGKYRQGFGVPFDLEELLDSVAIDIDSINFVRLVDVVGSVDSLYGSFDSNGQLINDPFPTEFPSSGFDLDAIGVIHQINPLKIEKELELEFTVYPNPASQYIKINLESSSENLRYTFYELAGKVVQLGKVEAGGMIDINHIAVGIYLFEINNGQQSKTVLISVKK